MFSSGEVYLSSACFIIKTNIINEKYIVASIYLGTTFVAYTELFFFLAHCFSAEII